MRLCKWCYGFLRQGRLLDDTTPSIDIPSAVWDDFILYAALQVHSMCQAQRIVLGEILEILLKAGLRSDFEFYVMDDLVGESVQTCLFSGTGSGGAFGRRLRDMSKFPQHLFKHGQGYSFVDLVDRLPLDNAETLKGCIRENIAREHVCAASSSSWASDIDDEDGCQSAETNGPGFSDLECLAGLDAEVESGPNTAETDSRIAAPAADLALEKAAGNSEIVMPSPFGSRIPTSRNRRWDFVTLHDLTSWYPLITFALGRCSVHIPSLI